MPEIVARVNCLITHTSCHKNFIHFLLSSPAFYAFQYSIAQQKAILSFYSSCKIIKSNNNTINISKMYTGLVMDEKLTHTLLSYAII